MESSGYAGQAVAPPAVTQRKGDRDDLRPTPQRHAIDVADEFPEEIVGMQFVDEQFQQCAGALELCAVCGEQPHRTRPKLFAPPSRIELLFGSNGIVELTINVVHQVTELAHGYTSNTDGTHLVARRLCGGPGPPARIHV
jgi:hypothetical protein